MLCEPKIGGGLGDQRAIRRRRADHHFLDADGQYPADLIAGSNAAAIGERHECLGGEFFDHRVVRLTPFQRRPDIDHDQFVALQVVEQLHGIDRIPQIQRILEATSLEQLAAGELQAGNDARAQRAHADAKLPSSCSPKRWLFSG